MATQAKIANKQKGKRKIFLYFCKNFLEVGEMKTRGKGK
jgi:hypothetical protein